MKNDSFGGDGLTLSGKARKLRVDFDADTQQAHHYIAQFLLRRLTVEQAHEIRHTIEAMLDETHREAWAQGLAMACFEQIRRGRISKADVIAALSDEGGQ
jgi:hypothetical protein